MTSSPSPSGRVLHRICPSCDRDITDEVAMCPTCGSKLVEIRDDADALIGQVIDDRFEIRDKLGQGGMGTVEYRGAEQPAPVALRLERGEAPITMKASFKGYQTTTFTITPDRDQTRSIVLKNVAVKKPAADEATPF